MEFKAIKLGEIIMEEWMVRSTRGTKTEPLLETRRRVQGGKGDYSPWGGKKSDTTEHAHTLEENTASD